MHDDQPSADALYTAVYGDGPHRILALHGWGGDHREFAPIAARRPPGGQLLSPDLPGYGRSPAPPEWTPGALLAPITEMLARQEPDPIPVAGFCSGVFPALLLARDHPERVSRLVLVDPFSRVPWYFRHFTWGWFGRKAFHATFHGTVGRALTNGTLRRRQASKADFTAAFSSLDPALVIRYLKLFAKHGDGHDFSQLTLPIDLVYGERTFAAVRATVREWSRQWPQARVHILPGIGHLPLVEAARELAVLLWNGERL